MARSPKSDAIRATAALKLSDPSLLTTRAYVNGQWLESDQTLAVTNPLTGKIVAYVADINVLGAAWAINAAYDAKDYWVAQTGKERENVLRAWYDLLVANADDLATILTAEMCKPWAATHGETLYGAAFIE